MDNWQALGIALVFLSTSGLGGIVWALVRSYFKIENLEKEITYLKEKSQKQSERHIQWEKEVRELLLDIQKKIIHIETKLN